MEESAKARGTGIAKRSIAYIIEKMIEDKAVIALTEDNTWVGFCYIEEWSHGEFVANSGLIVAPAFQKNRYCKTDKAKNIRAVKREISQLKNIWFNNRSCRNENKQRPGL